MSQVVAPHPPTKPLTVSLWARSEAMASMKTCHLAMLSTFPLSFSPFLFSIYHLSINQSIYLSPIYLSPIICIYLSQYLRIP